MADDQVHVASQTGQPRNAIAARLTVPVVVTLPDEIDITNASGVVGEGLRAMLVPGAAIIADMARTLFCDSSGIRQLLIAHDLAVANQAELRIVIGSPAVLRALKAIGADQILTIYPTLLAALTAQPAANPRAT